MGVINCHWLKDEGNSAAGSSGPNPALQSISMWSLSCHKAFWSSSAETERWIQGASGSWYLYCSCTVAVTADTSIFVCVFLHWRAMTGTVVQLSSWVLRCDWLAVTGHGVRVTDSRVRAHLGVHCFVEKDTRVLPPKHHNCWTFCSSTPHEHDMFWPYPAQWYLDIITLYWYTELNGIM